HIAYQMKWAGNAFSLRRQFAWPFLSVHQWYGQPISRLLSSFYLEVDYSALSRFFALFVLGFVLISTALVFLPGQVPRIKLLAATNILFLILGSFLDEKFFPVP